MSKIRQLIPNYILFISCFLQQEFLSFSDPIFILWTGLEALSKPPSLHTNRLGSATKGGQKMATLASFRCFVKTWWYKRYLDAIFPITLWALERTWEINFYSLRLAEFFSLGQTSLKGRIGPTDICSYQSFAKESLSLCRGSFQVLLMNHRHKAGGREHLAFSFLTGLIWDQKQ